MRNQEKNRWGASAPFHIMDFSHGILFLLIGCTVTLIGFYIGFLVINYNKRKELKKLQEIENNKKLTHRYFGDDTV